MSPPSHRTITAAFIPAPFARPIHTVHPVSAQLAGEHPDSSPLTALPIFPVPHDSSVPLPGDSRPLQLPLSFVRHLATSSHRSFALASHARLNAPSPLPVRASLLTVLNVAPARAAADHIAVDCQCPCRLALHNVYPAPSANTHPVADALRVYDRPVVHHHHRARITETEWAVWQLLRQLAQLREKLGVCDDVASPPPGSGEQDGSISPSSPSAPPTSQQPPLGGRLRDDQLALWAPRDYDRELSEAEWRRTPDVLRRMWSRRAESFSFAALRASAPSESELAAAYEDECTLHRLEEVETSARRELSRLAAQASIKDALG